MRGCSPVGILAAIIVFGALVAQANAVYWFQSGITGGGGAYYNTGAKVSIQTITPQSSTYGSFGYWVGEDLSNGAFLQIGYVVPNATGYYPNNCTEDFNGNATCSSGVYLTSGEPSWFWEYFPPNAANNTFFGGYGPSDSAGANGTFNTYSFEASGNTWSFYFNGNIVGRVYLGAPASGMNAPEAIAEYADARSNTTRMQAVQFKNLESMNNGGFQTVQYGYANIGYGKGSQTALANPYGVKEIGQYTDYFEVGSNVPIPRDGSQLWGTGYKLSIVSSVQNTSSAYNYTAYDNVRISEPAEINVSPGVRDVFEGWRGEGYGSYTGNESSPLISMYGDIEENAIWQTQYKLNVSSQYAGSIDVPGGSWYNSGAEAVFAVNQSDLTLGYSKRAIFAGWSTGTNAISGEVKMTSPINISANWDVQYLINATSIYGQTFGSGWYDAGALAVVRANTSTVTISRNSRMEFSGWSNGYSGLAFTFNVIGPLFVHAEYAEQYLTNFSATNAYGGHLDGVQYYTVSNQVVTGPTFLYANGNYEVQSVGFDGVNIGINKSISVTHANTIVVKLPVYNVTVAAVSWLGLPVNASIDVTFKNGTKLVSHLGPTGVMNFNGLPYGQLSGNISDFLFTEKVNVANGTDAKLSFITPDAIIAVIVIFAAIVLAVRELARRDEEQNKWRRGKK